jgi:hypothetical protein
MMDHDGIHWYCKFCNKGAEKLYKDMIKLNKRQDQIEVEVTNMKTCMKDMQDKIDQVQNLAIDVDNKLDVAIEAKLTATVNEKVKEVKKEASDVWQVVMDKKVDKVIEDKVKTIEKDLDDKVVNISKDVKEIMEIEHKKNNLIIHGVREDPSCKDDDFVKDILVDCFHLNLANHVIMDLQRFGKKITGKDRPIRIRMENYDSKIEILRKAKNLKNEAKFKNVYITPDLTKKQLLLDKELREKCKKFKDDGEPDAKIRGGKVIKNSPGGETIVLYSP